MCLLSISYGDDGADDCCIPFGTSKMIASVYRIMVCDDSDARRENNDCNGQETSKPW